MNSAPDSAQRISAPASSAYTPALAGRRYPCFPISIARKRSNARLDPKSSNSKSWRTSISASLPSPEGLGKRLERAGPDAARFRAVNRVHDLADSGEFIRVHRRSFGCANQRLQATLIPRPARRHRLTTRRVEPAGYFSPSSRDRSAVPPSHQREKAIGEARLIQESAENGEFFGALLGSPGTLRDSWELIQEGRGSICKNTNAVNRKRSPQMAARAGGGRDRQLARNIWRGLLPRRCPQGGRSTGLQADHSSR